MNTPKLLKRDPRNLAREVPGILGLIFPRLNNIIVKNLNKKTIKINNLECLESLTKISDMSHAMLFEISMCYAVDILDSGNNANFNKSVERAISKQRKYYDAQIPNNITDNDIKIIKLSASNLLKMIKYIKKENENCDLKSNPIIPGFGWINNAKGDFYNENILVEVKHTNSNFRAKDYRQVLMYYLLKYSNAIKKNENIWKECILINPRKNLYLSINFSELIYLLSGSDELEAYNLFRVIIEQGFTQNQ